MKTKQVNIAVPIKLYEKIQEHIEEYGYINAQDLFLDLARKKVIIDNVDNLPLREDFVQRILEIDKPENYLSDEEADAFDKELEERAKLE